MMSGYLENDEDILNYLNSFQEKYKMRGKHKVKKVRRLIDKGKEMKKQFSIDDNEIEDIFDLVEEEGPTL
jgi:hypothetical protein